MAEGRSPACPGHESLTRLVASRLRKGAFDACVSEGSAALRGLASKRGWLDRRVVGLDGLKLR
eukprot:3565053-Heterocapsa_arctica.AAC.1